jgi:hypothetical protein
VAAGDLNAAVQIEVVDGEVEQGRGPNSDVDHVQAGLEEPRAKSAVQPW